MADLAFRDLHEYLRALDERGELQRVTVPVDPYLEMAEIADRMVARGGPALLFTNVKGSQFPVAMNLFGTQARTNFALGLDDPDRAGQMLRTLIQPPEIGGFWDKVRALPKLAELSSYFPKVVREAPCQEIVETDPDLTRLPVLTTWPQDGGPFITLPLVCTRDPATGRRNLGMYRMQVYDARTAGMHWHLHKGGRYHLLEAKNAGERRLPVAVALGGDPATIYAATAPLPRDIDEYVLAGFLRRAPVELVRAKTVDVEVPAHAEFVLEGYVDVDELRMEGPFGDHTGYYSLAAPYPVFHVTAITRRRDAIYPATVVGRPPKEDAYLGKITERLFLPLIQMLVPDVVDMSMPPAGVFHNLVIVSIDKHYPGQARQTMYALWGVGQMANAKHIVVVDKDVNVHDMDEVIWRVTNNIDAARDVVIVQGPLDDLDHASPEPHFGGKMGIDATRKLPEEGHPRPWPDDIVMPPEIRTLVDRRWREYGFRS